MTALITGASRGLGAFIARRLAAVEPVVVNYARDSAGAARVVDDIIAAGGQARAYKADVTDFSAVQEMLDSVGPVRVVVANATGPQPLIAAEETTWEDHLRQLEFFVKSPTLLMQAALPGMKELGGGRIIMIGSDSFERALPLASAYNAAKGAQIGLARTWARELGRYGVTVNVVAPGWIPVERHGDADTAGYVAEVPLGRIGTPDDIADVVAFVASDAARFVTGERITVNGGHTID
ncbi:SDR family oxidoreductase [Paractinoplanes atraurantiacus]|uniref:3-oxoacyl-[acyl-carrier protein] reductase n=1 Tax=Paractinoplanes atraurantiacus TaxID=1036182 RepID=A0A285J7Z3_9ACTN|nr:SDR family oxidoreductase [Actinoplanes atraurantiacus]SNY56394.1 3-oxoacyl-[acyl-carrier protein] reductase [Actinoplanes atraurantiacus]